MKEVHIIGAGGIGWWFTVGLASSCPLPIHVYDDAEVIGSGAQRLPIGVGNKTQALSSFIRYVMGKGNIHTHDIKFTGTEASDGDWIFDCSDAGENDRKKIWTKARKKETKIMRVSYDGDEDIIEVSSELPFWVGDMTEGYREVPSLQLSLAAGGIGAVIADKIIQRNETVPKTIQINLETAMQLGKEEVA